MLVQTCEYAPVSEQGRRLEALLRPEVFRALGDPNRLALLVRVATARAPMTVSEAADCCGVHISGASRHLAVLRDAGILEATKEGREVRYRVAFGDLVELLRGLAEALERCAGPRGACCPAGDPAGGRDEAKSEAKKRGENG